MAPQLSRKFGLRDTATQGSADAEALVYNDPGIVYEAQFTAGTPAVSFIGSKYTLSTTAGSTTNW